MKLNALGVHVFAGGFGIGLSNHHDIVSQFELEGGPMKGPRASEHRQVIADAKHNHLWEVIENHPKEFECLECNDEIGVVFGNPPCAPWSSMNTNNRDWRNDDRLTLARDIINTGRRLEANVILVESVVRSWTAGRNFWLEEAYKLMEHGYSIYFWLHNVNALGGWQNRKRFMFVASKFELEFPEVLDVMSRPVLRDHIALMEDLERTVSYVPKAATPELFEFWSQAKPGPLRKQVNGHQIPAPPFIARKLGLDLPAPTIVGRYVIHPTEPRCLDWGEFRHLLGFPRSWQTTRPQVKSGDVEAGILPMTRGVCPTVGEHIGLIISNSDKMVDTPEMIIVDQR